MEQSVLYSKVRVLHAACFAPVLCVMIGNREVVKELCYGESSGYVRVTGGFRRVSVTCKESGEELVVETIPFPEGSQMTLVVCNTMNKLSLVVMPEVTCNAGEGKGALRVANYTFDDGPFQVMQGSEAVYSCVSACTCTPFLPAAAGTYDLWLAKTDSCIEVDEEACSLKSDGADSQKEDGVKPEVEIHVKVMPGISYTACILGACDSSVPLDVRILEF